MTSILIPYLPLGILIYGLNWFFYKDRIRSNEMPIQTIRSRAMLEFAAILISIYGGWFLWMAGGPGNLGYNLETVLGTIFFLPMVIFIVTLNLVLMRVIVWLIEKWLKRTYPEIDRRVPLSNLADPPKSDVQSHSPGGN